MAIGEAVLVLVCASSVPFGHCWPKTADVMFVAGDSEEDQPDLAVRKRRIDLRHRYIVVRTISCNPEVSNVSQEGKDELPGACRDIGTANGHCPSPLYEGQCPN